MTPEMPLDRPKAVNNILACSPPPPHCPAASERDAHFMIMKTRDAILLTVALFLLTSLVRVGIAGTIVPLSYFMIFGTAIWAAIDSSTIQLKRYRTGISYGPVVLFLGFLLLWVVAFPWYLSVRSKIKAGTALLKDEATNASA